MTKYFTNIFSVLTLHKKPSTRSEVITQMLYGDSFSVSKKTKICLRVKIKVSNYWGYVQNKNFSDYLKPTHKVHILKARIYKFPNKRKKTNELSFGSKVKITNYKAKFFKFSKGLINKKDVNPIS